MKRLISSLRRVVTMEEVFEVSVVDEEGASCDKTAFKSGGSGYGDDGGVSIEALDLADGGAVKDSISTLSSYEKGKKKKKPEMMKVIKAVETDSVGGGDLREAAAAAVCHHCGCASKAARQTTNTTTTTPSTTSSSQKPSIDTADDTSNRQVTMSSDQRKNARKECGTSVTPPGSLNTSGVNNEAEVTSESALGSSVSSDAQSPPPPTLSPAPSTTRSPLRQAEDALMSIISSPSTASTPTATSSSTVAAEAASTTTSTSSKMVPKWKMRERQPNQSQSLFKRTNDKLRAKRKSVNYDGTVAPDCKRSKKITLVTSQGPKDVTLMPHKAVKCDDEKYMCPVPGCDHPRGSRVWLAKHFDRDHPDYRSWRGVFLQKDAPEFVVNEGPDDASVCSEEEEEGEEEEEEEETTLEMDTEVVEVDVVKDVDEPPMRLQASNEAEDKNEADTVENVTQEITEEQVEVVEALPTSASISSSTMPSWTAANRTPVCSTMAESGVATPSAFAPVRPVATAASIPVIMQQQQQQQQQQQLAGGFLAPQTTGLASAASLAVSAPTVALSLAAAGGGGVSAPTVVSAPMAAGLSPTMAAAGQPHQVIIMNSTPQGHQALTAPQTFSGQPMQSSSPPMASVPMALVPLSHLQGQFILQNGHVISQPPPPPPVRYKVVQVAVPKRIAQQALAAAVAASSASTATPMVARSMANNLFVLPQAAAATQPLQTFPDMTLASTAAMAAAPSPVNFLPASTPLPTAAAPQILMPVFPVHEASHTCSSMANNLFVLPQAVAATQPLQTFLDMTLASTAAMAAAPSPVNFLPASTPLPTAAAPQILMPVFPVQ